MHSEGGFYDKKVPAPSSMDLSLTQLFRFVD